jgi:hypothetical protein
VTATGCTALPCAAWQHCMRPRGSTARWGCCGWEGGVGEWVQLVAGACCSRRCKHHVHRTGSNSKGLHSKFLPGHTHIAGQFTLQATWLCCCRLSHSAASCLVVTASRVADLVAACLLCLRHGPPSQAESLLETALELRRQVFSAGSYLYADTASALAAALIKQHKAAADSGASSSSSSSSSSSGGGGGWLRGRGKAAAEPAGVLRAIALYQAAIDIVVDAGAWLVGKGSRTVP